MIKRTATWGLALVAALASGAALAKLPPLNDDAKAKAAEAAAKTGHANKVADFQLCKSMDRVAASYRDSAKKAGQEVKPATPTPACADPGPLVYPPPAPGAPPVVATAKPAAAPAKK
jgi:hypothetical protein